MFVVFLRYCFTFLILTLFVYLGGICIWGEFFPPLLNKNLSYFRFEIGNTYERLAEAKTKKNIAILFLGSSHAYRTFDTRIYTRLGYDCFNLGTSGQSPLQTLTLLKRYSQINAKLVIIEVFPFNFESNGAESCVDLLSNDLIDYPAIDEVIKINQLLTYNSLIFCLYKNYISPFTKINKKDTTLDCYIKGGFVQRRLSFFNPKEKLKPKNWKLLPQQLLALDEVLAILKRKDIPFILVQSPITHYLYNSYKNNEEIDSVFSKKGKYINFNVMVNLTDSLHFYDDNHLNQIGVKIFNKALISYLYKEKLLNRNRIMY
jgi:hypothetical protein